MEIENLRVGQRVLFEFSHEYEGHEFFNYEQAIFVGGANNGRYFRPKFEGLDMLEWEAYQIDGKWFRADSVELIPGESVESVRLVEVL